MTRTARGRLHDNRARPHADPMTPIDSSRIIGHPGFLNCGNPTRVGAPENHSQRRRARAGDIFATSRTQRANLSRLVQVKASSFCRASSRTRPRRCDASCACSHNRPVHSGPSNSYRESTSPQSAMKCRGVERSTEKIWFKVELETGRPFGSLAKLSSFRVARRGAPGVSHADGNAQSRPDLGPPQYVAHRSAACR